NDCIVPVMNDGRFDAIIFGRSVDIASFQEDVDLSHLNNVAVMGTFIDIELTSTYDQHVEFLAEFVPVFKRGRLLGLCDPHELRFWLRETSRLRLETDLADITYYG